MMVGGVVARMHVCKAIEQHKFEGCALYSDDGTDAQVKLMANTFGFNGQTLAADITRLSTGYAQESCDKLQVMMKKYRGLARRMQAELDGSVMGGLSEAEADYCFSTALFTATMTDQCAGQKKCLKLLKMMKDEKIKEFEVAASPEEKAARSTELDEIEFLYCGVHMGVNLAVGFDGFMKSHSKAENSLCANVEASHPTLTLTLTLSLHLNLTLGFKRMKKTKMHRSSLRWRLFWVVGRWCMAHQMVKLQERVWSTL